jgi:hypothetical protein
VHEALLDQSPADDGRNGCVCLEADPRHRPLVAYSVERLAARNLGKKSTAQAGPGSTVVTWVLVGRPRRTSRHMSLRSSSTPLAGLRRSPALANGRHRAGQSGRRPDDRPASRLAAWPVITRAGRAHGHSTFIARHCAGCTSETAKENGWTPERWARQANAIHRWKPRERSTRPTSVRHEARSAKRGFRDGQRALLRELSRALPGPRPRVRNSAASVTFMGPRSTFRRMNCATTRCFRIVARGGHAIRLESYAHGNTGTLGSVPSMSASG